jgi:hypothetical protein
LSRDNPVVNLGLENALLCRGFEKTEEKTKEKNEGKTDERL